MRSSTKESRSGRTMWAPLMKVMGGFFVVGSILFVHVWLPIQSERNLILLRRMEGQVSLKKVELNELNESYFYLTSLSALDHWAKKNGPWVSAQINNVIAIEK
jgi:hypothetical protein